jgi:hypothetical protein
MPQISSCRDARRPIRLRNCSGRRLRKNIETITALMGKEHCFGGEIIYIKHRACEIQNKHYYHNKNFEQIAMVCNMRNMKSVR